MNFESKHTDLLILHSLPNMHSRHQHRQHGERDRSVETRIILPDSATSSWRDMAVFVGGDGLMTCWYGDVDGFLGDGNMAFCHAGDDDVFGYCVVACGFCCC